VSFSLMVSTDDQRVVWVSDSFADHVGVRHERLVGRRILEVLTGSCNETWATLFAGAPATDERFDGFGLHLVGDSDPIDRFELRSVRYVDDGRAAMVSLRRWHADSEWESSEAFVSDVRAAMLAGDIYVAYQPIVDIRSGQLKKVEALARWTHPDRGVIGPDVFIPWAEATGVIDELGEWVFDRSCRDVVRMEAEGIDVDLSVNVSVVQLRDADVSQRFGDMMAQARLAPERVWIEVTESVLLDAEALSLLMAVHSLGVRLVIDDFGTGHANFDYLTRLVVDSLKIDTTFVAELGTESRATAIVRSVVALGRELGLEIVAEGIETEAQRSQLLDLHCRFGQGWLFSPALRYDVLVARYRADDSTSPTDVTEESPGTDELMRRSALRACRILDTDPEPAFDSLAQLASQLLSVPMAVISFVDTDREWVKARCGTDITEVERSVSLFPIAAARPEDLPLIVDDTTADDRSTRISLIRASPHARSYVGMPIRSREGLALGTFGVIDTRPRSFTPRELGHLALLADQVSELLDLRRRTVELDDLYIEARHSMRPARPFDDLLQTAVDAAPGNGTLAQLTRIAGHRVAAPRNDVDVLRFDGLTLHLQNRTITVGGQLIEPPAKEFDLLAFLAARPGQVFNRSELLQHVWKSSPEWQDVSTVTEHIHRLRVKIDRHSNRSPFLRTTRGRGYSFEPADPQVTGDDADAIESRCGTWAHVDYRVIAADAGMVELLAARTSADLIGREVDHFVAPISQPALRAAREMRASGIVPGARLITLLAVDGTERLCLISSAAGEFEGRPAVIGSAREIVDAPRLMRQMVSGVVAEVSDAVVVTDPDLRVLSWNPAACRLYGWSEQEALGHTLHAVVGDDTLSHGGAPWDELQRNGSWTGVLRQRTRDGTTVMVTSSVSLLRDQGEITGIAVVNHVLPPGLEAGAPGGATALRTGADRPHRESGVQPALHDAAGPSSALAMSPVTAFDWLTRLAARLLGAPIAAVSLIGRDRQWFVSGVGVETTADLHDAAFTSLAIAAPDEVFIVNDALLDERVANDPFVTGAPFARSCAAMSICSRDGMPIGTLSVIDTAAREFTEQEIRFLKVLSLQAETLFDQRRRAGKLDGRFAEPTTGLHVDTDPIAALDTAPVERTGGTVSSISRVRRQALAASHARSDIDPEAATTRLAAARSLLRAEAVEEAVGVVIGVVRDLGGSTIPARLDDRNALPLDCSLGHGEPLLARPDSALARLRIERILPEVLDDAREVIGRLRQRDDYAELSNTDPLTGLLNRRAVDRLLPRLGPDDAVIVIDIDHFKEVNDNWGHAVGDELLIAFARALRSYSRAGDQFGRLGGDELLAVLVDAGGAGLESFLRRLNATWLSIRPREVTYSVGATLIGQRTGPEALAAADAAMYRAKAMGRDQVAVEAAPTLPAGTPLDTESDDR
jgi:diguanylate cyclase (GGDEF)-like protein/PAS domain S-box-containing protein